MLYNTIHKKGQFILLIVYADMAYDFNFILFILGFIILLGLNLSHKQSSHRDLIMKHPKKNESNVISQKRCFSTSNRSRVNKIEDNSSQSLRKTLKSPQSRPYKDLYKGRGKPKYVLPSDEKVSDTSKSLPEPQVPEKIYPNSDTCKAEILSDNQKKSGIYMFTNLKNGKRYIGSSENLRARFLKYFNTNYLLRNIQMYICRSLFKHGYSNFSLTILEYCSPEKCLIREKHYWDLLNPEYNIAKDPTAPMSGRKHSDETKILMSETKKGENNPMFGKNHSEETKTKISDAIIGENHPMYGKPKPEGAGRLSQQIEVTDIKNNQTTIYDSIREAARVLNCDSSAIRYYLNSKKINPYKGRYVFQKRLYSTSRKTLTSPQPRPYKDLYKGRGKQAYEPEWVKDNGMERSRFGASWAKNEADRLPYPSKYPLNYQNIKDPYNNRKLIKEICKGNRVVYIWTYIPTGICLVGSSSNSVERVLSYFEKKYLFLDFRKGVQFLADYGFENIQLTLIYLDNQKFTMRDIKILEAYYINELNSNLNSQK